MPPTRHGVATLAAAGDVDLLGRGRPDLNLPFSAQPALFAASAQSFLSTPALAEEVFGPSSILVRCSDADEMLRVIESLEGQLTATLQFNEGDLNLAARMMPALERLAGRIIGNCFPTNVEVTHAMVHGGPWPATSDARTTSVGARAIDRFLRPVSYQNLPQELLGPALQDDNPLGVWREVDGEMGQH